MPAVACGSWHAARATSADKGACCSVGAAALAGALAPVKAMLPRKCSVLRSALLASALDDLMLTWADISATSAASTTVGDSAAAGSLSGAAIAASVRVRDGSATLASVRPAATTSSK